MILHEMIPVDLTPDERSAWIAKNHREMVTDTDKIYYKPEEIQEFEKESSVHGRELARLSAIVRTISALVKKGNDSSTTSTIVVFLAEGAKVDIKQKDDQNIITIPATIGTKELEIQRSQNYAALEKGYEIKEVQLYGIPCYESETMEFFDIDANHYPARSRDLTIKEMKEIFGLFMMSNKGNKMKVVEEGTVDTSTGELSSAVGQ